MSHVRITNLLLEIALNDAINLTKVHLPVDKFKALLNAETAYIEKHRICEGEMVGYLAATAIGEPTTQMTLNTFHLSGVQVCPDFANTIDRSNVEWRSPSL